MWDSHVVREEPGRASLIYIDLHLVHEVTSPQAFQGLRERGLKVRRPDLTVATTDHSIPTSDRSLPILDPIAAKQVEQLATNCKEFGIPHYGVHSTHQGIVHVIGPELGFTQPGMTVVCGDSHTATHGAFGALAFGIGTSEVENVLATQCLLQRPSKTFQCRSRNAEDRRFRQGHHPRPVRSDRHRRRHRHGSRIRRLRHARARYGRPHDGLQYVDRSGRARRMVAPDDTTFNYLHGREFAPKGKDWDDAVARWKKLPTDEGAKFDREVLIDGDALEPMITWGTNPGMGVSDQAPSPSLPVSPILLSATPSPRPSSTWDSKRASRSSDIPSTWSSSAAAPTPASPICASPRLLKGRKVNPNVRVMVVPGSMEVKRQAIAEGLPEIFRAAGCDWREPGCSMCIAMNGDQLEPGQYSVSTSNRNFEGRQGKGGRTFLASPLTAAASAITGVVTDVRTLL